MYGVWSLYTDALIKMIFLYLNSNSGSDQPKWQWSSQPFTYKLHTELLSGRLNNMGIKQNDVKEKKQDQEHT